VGGEKQRLFDRVRDEENHLAAAMPDVEDELLDRFARERIECPERLVHQQELRVGSERPRDADALLHPAGQFVDRALGKILDTDQLELLPRYSAPLGGLDAAHAQAELDVVDDIEPGHERMLLEHDAAVGAGPGHRLAVELNLAFGRGEKAGDAIEQCGLPAA
jgi:hypothetical protein